jgi:hypothetical protein
MGFKKGQIVENYYPIFLQVKSDTYMVSNLKKLEPQKKAVFEPENWLNYEKIEIEPGRLFKVLSTREVPVSSQEREACMGLPHPNDRVIVQFLETPDCMEKDWLEQPALVFRPTAAGDVLYGNQEED